ncbi:MAG TPA: choline ABC transporter substrate-binding protein [Gammaproteobacteria bacterium]|nr:choline ABC transporter substrate-binding protein [Gammaproteobacteria bacterium]
MSRIRLRQIALAGVAALGVAGGAGAAGDPPACKSVHFSDVGWSCITATTAIASNVLEGLGYEPKASVLSVPITFESLSNGDIDAFLGLWLPTQESMIKPYFDKGSIDRVTSNLEGAKYTLAVSKSAYDAGVKSFSDLDKFGDKFDKKVYAIEPGNDGNQIIIDMIQKDAYGLGDWEIVESSEAGMLSQVQRAVNRNKWVVFLGWEPHPMNRRFDIAYLSGGDDYFGPNYGGATVYTLAPKGYTAKCPNVGTLLKNLKFSLATENEIMGYMLDDGMDPNAAAKKLIKQNPELLEKWLAGVTTFDGRNGTAAVKKHLGM